jgi:formyl-CoA transferase
MPHTTRMWDTLVTAIDRPDLATDERFQTVQARARHGDELDAEISKWTIQHTKFEVMDYLGPLGVPVGAVFDTNDIFEDRHLNARGQIMTYEHPGRGTVKMPAPPIHLSGSVVPVVVAPELGQHTAEVLAAELGIGGEALDSLAAEGVVGLLQTPAGVAAGV